MQVAWNFERKWHNTLLDGSILDRQLEMPPLVVSISKTCSSMWKKENTNKENASYGNDGKTRRRFYLIQVCTDHCLEKFRLTKIDFLIESILYL